MRCGRRCVIAERGFQPIAEYDGLLAMFDRGDLNEIEYRPVADDQIALPQVIQGCDVYQTDSVDERMMDVFEETFVR